MLPDILEARKEQKEMKERVKQKQLIESAKQKLNFFDLLHIAQAMKPFTERIERVVILNRLKNTYWLEVSND